MASIIEFKQSWRVAGMAILIFALIGPWTYEVINVPAEYSCSAPYVRLEGDFCGEPMPGYWIVLWLAQGLMYNFAGLLTGTVGFAGRGREFLFMLLSIFPLLPLLSTPLVLWRKDSPGSNRFQLVAWGLATILGVFWIVSAINLPPHRILWGIWIYIVLTLSVLVLELLALVVERKARQRS
jgi:hypothetical protein